MREILLILALLLFITACDNSSKSTPKLTKVNHTTLLVASEGSIINYNLDENNIHWEYKSPLDSTGNRNYFVVDGQSVFMPFESGRLINFDVNTGKVSWRQQIYGNEGALEMSSEENAEAEMLQSVMPLFMSKPLVDGDNVVIASSGQPMLASAYIYSFNLNTGEKTWHENLPTVFNIFAPIKFRGFYFVNSAVYLEKFNAKDGTNTSYGMFDGMPDVAGEPSQNYEPSEFEFPIYCQMQTDGNNIYIGDEQGKIFSFHLDKTANVPNADITDPSNTFIKNPKVFRWVFSDENFSFQRNGLSFLKDGVLFVEMKNGSATESCVFALHAGNGKVKWKKTINGDILNWSLHNDKIVGNTENTVFYTDTNGDNFIETHSERKVLSNIECMDKTHLIYITEKGIEVFDTNTKTAKVVLEKPYSDNQHNNVQIKFIAN